MLSRMKTQIQKHKLQIMNQISNKGKNSKAPLAGGDGGIRVGIIGGAGYTGGELIRLLIHHPYTTVSFIHSRSSAGTLVSSVHHDLVGDIDLKFVDKLRKNIDVLFLCVGHGEAKKFLEENKVDDKIKIIDI